MRLGQEVDTPVCVCLCGWVGVGPQGPLFRTGSTTKTHSETHMRPAAVALRPVIGSSADPKRIITADRCMLKFALSSW